MTTHVIQIKEPHMVPVRRVLRQRLENKGLNSSTIPGYMRSLTNALVKKPHMTLNQVNRHMDYVGWRGVELDYHTWELTRATLESEKLAAVSFDAACFIEIHLTCRYSSSEIWNSRNSAVSRRWVRARL